VQSAMGKIDIKEEEFDAILAAKRDPALLKQVKIAWWYRPKK
jgi:hypothetical protein